MKFYFNKKSNLYTKIVWNNKTYFIETDYFSYNGESEIKLVVWYYDKILWFTFKKVYHNVSIVSPVVYMKTAIERELIQAFGSEFESLIKTTRRKEKIKNLLLRNIL